MNNDKPALIFFVLFVFTLFIGFISVEIQKDKVKELKQRALKADVAYYDAKTAEFKFKGE